MALNFDRALEIVHKAREVAKARGLEVSVAVLDAAGHPVLVARGKDEAWHGPYMATGKARLAAAFRRPTDEMMARWQDRPMFPISLVEMIPGGVTLNPGGVPLFEGGKCIGAIGIGGSSPDNDAAVAAETAAALGLAER